MTSSRTRPPRPVVLVAAALVAALAASATVAQEDAPPPPCSAEEHRRFDFWAGTWEVRDDSGTVVGSNRITPILNGCVLLEEWTAAGGASAGKSFNIYDRTRGVWHQTWVDGNGLLLQIEGGWRDGAMILEGEGIARDGNEVRHRIRWTPLEDGRVRQVWESSRDDGSTWSTAFDGYYTRTGEAGRS